MASRAFPSSVSLFAVVYILKGGLQMTSAEAEGLGIALNEATLLGVEIDPSRRIAAVTLRVLTLPEDGPPPADSRLQLLLQPVGRIAASLRGGRWDDPAAPVLPLKEGDVLTASQSFGCLPIYGWRFFDLPGEDFKRWSSRLSLDSRLGMDGHRHTITLFQEGNDRHLDLRIWFDDLEFRTTDGCRIGLIEVIEGGKRWWDRMYAGDPRTHGCGIMPLR